MLEKKNILEYLKNIHVNSKLRTHMGKSKVLDDFVCYQSFILDETEYKGNRNCNKRINKIKTKIDFQGKNILDIGCNIGNMLFTIKNDINYACGIDFNHRTINGANLIKKYNNIKNLDFYNFDLENDNLELIKCLIDKVDIVFLLSICMWIQNWKDVIKFIKNNYKVLVIEVNGDNQKSHINYCKKMFKKVELISEQSDDDPFQKKRKLFICEN